MKISIAGRAWRAAIEDSAVPAQENWPAPTFQTRGSGTLVSYECTRDQAWLITTHLEDIASCFTDPENRADRYVIQQSVRSLYNQIASQS